MAVGTRQLVCIQSRQQRRLRIFCLFARNKRERHATVGLYHASLIWSGHHQICSPTFAPTDSTGPSASVDSASSSEDCIIEKRGVLLMCNPLRDFGSRCFILSSIYLFISLTAYAPAWAALAMLVHRRQR